MPKKTRPLSSNARRNAFSLADIARPEEFDVFPAVCRAAAGPVLCTVCIALAGCGSAGGGGGGGGNPGLLDAALGTVGLQRAQPPQMPQMPGVDGMHAMDGAWADAAGRLAQAPRRIAFRLHAGEVLNTDGRNQSLSVVVKLYKLRDKDAFEAAPYADFQRPKPGAAAEFAADVVESREIVMTPGKRHEVIETVRPDAPYLGVVALFRAPAEKRWRYVFDSKAAARTGVTMGVHACALSVAAGQALDAAPEMTRVAGVQCGE